MKTKDRKYGNILKRIVSGVLIITLTAGMPVAQKAEKADVKAETVSRRVKKIS